MMPVDNVTQLKLSSTEEYYRLQCSFVRDRKVGENLCHSY